ncbi:MAG: hypothetical protein HYY08_03765 [Firmicutes bacterium]|nr:hypothetical protein [Bacillota bacterium]
MIRQTERGSILSPEESARGYSSFSGFSVERSEWVPAGSPFRQSGGKFVPVRHDGFVVGNGLVAAVLGWKALGGVPMMSSMSFIDGCRTPASVGQVLADDLVSERELSPVWDASQAALRGYPRLLPAQAFVVYQDKRSSKGCCCDEEAGVAAGVEDKFADAVSLSGPKCFERRPEIVSLPVIAVG